MLRSGTAQTTDMAHAMSHRWEFKYWIHPMLHEKKALSAEYGAFYATQAGICRTQGGATSETYYNGFLPEMQSLFLGCFSMGDMVR